MHGASGPERGGGRGALRVRVRFPRPFRDAVGAAEVDFEPRSARLLEALQELAERYPALGPKLFEGAGLSPFVNVYRNDAPVHGEDAAAVTLHDGDTLLLLLPLTGGCANV